ncbi:MAG: hypothetical protein F6K31_19435 [Symploca sp. SIO2G7]|nr:hypothetical protein [Symploca sp. SIO2G7]
MDSLVNQITLSEEEKHSFSEKGFIKLKKLLTNEAIDGLQKLIYNSNQMKNPPDFYSGELSKIGYDMEGAIVRNIYSSTNFKDVLRKLTGREITFMQSAGFEVKSNQKGFPWHHDLYSFCYIKPEDLGLTLWIPLIPINTKKQHGGLAYVSREIHSAYEYFHLVSQLLQDKKISNLCENKEFKDLNIQYASKLESLVLDNSKVEDDFELGDGLLLDKIIWHKSCPLKEGELPSRMAYVMRLVDGQARYSKVLLEGTYNLLESTGNDVQSNFGYHLAKHFKDGNMISENLAGLKSRTQTL